jgi:hypothetical protein
VISGYINSGSTVMARLICGKLAINPKKQGEIAAIAEK